MTTEINITPGMRRAISDLESNKTVVNNKGTAYKLKNIYRVHCGNTVKDYLTATDAILSFRK